MNQDLIDKILIVLRELNFDEFSNEDITTNNGLEEIFIELVHHHENYRNIKEKIQHIILGVSDFSAGDFSTPLPISDDGDEMDVICMSLNTFREELLSTTISRDYFNNIYNTVSEMVFVLDTDFQVTDANKAVLSHYYMNKKMIIGQHIEKLIGGEFLQSIKSYFDTELPFSVVKGEGVLKVPIEKDIPLECSLSRMVDKDYEHLGFVMVAKNISSRIKEEQLVFNAMVQAQEEERQRLAYDLHDSLGQELNAIKMQLSAVEFLAKSNMDKSLDLLRNTMLQMDEAVQNVRKISYDLMPTALERGSIEDALKELVSNIQSAYNIKVKTKIAKETSKFNSQFKLSIYRVVQEFINNSLKHAKANSLTIEIAIGKNGELRINLKDDGKGFNPEEVKHGNGLRSMRSRIKALNGNYDIKSKKGEGTWLQIKFENTYEEN